MSTFRGMREFEAPSFQLSHCRVSLVLSIHFVCNDREGVPLPTFNRVGVLSVFIWLWLYQQVAVGGHIKDERVANA